MINNIKVKRIAKHLSRYSQMLIRCYDKDCKAYKHYGAKGITVCNEWLNSPDSFIVWCENNGYSEELVLDKDILCDSLNISPKIYSPSTCMFITPKRNRQYMLETTCFQAVANYDSNGLLIKAYKNITDAGVITSSTNIGRAAKGKRLTAGGYFWRYIDSIETAPNTIVVPDKHRSGIPIVEIDKLGNIIAKYENIAHAAETLNLKACSIAQVVNGDRNSLFNRVFKKV